MKRLIFLSFLLATGCATTSNKNYPNWDYDYVVDKYFYVSVLSGVKDLKLNGQYFTDKSISAFQKRDSNNKFSPIYLDKSQFQGCASLYEGVEFDKKESILGVIIEPISTSSEQTKNSVYGAPDKDGKVEKEAREYISSTQIQSNVYVCDLKSKEVVYTDKIKSTTSNINRYSENCDKSACKLFQHIVQNRDFPEYPEIDKAVYEHAIEVAKLIPIIPCKKIGFWACLKRGFEK